MPMRLEALNALALGTAFGLFIWANTRVSSLTREFDLSAPESYGPVAAYLFTHGWPLSPWMMCPVHGMKFHPEETFVWLALIIDAALALLAVLIVGTLVEWCARTLEKRQAPNA